MGTLDQVRSCRRSLFGYPRHGHAPGPIACFLQHRRATGCSLQFVSRVHPRFRTPWITSIATGMAWPVLCRRLSPSAKRAVFVPLARCSPSSSSQSACSCCGCASPGLKRRFATPWVWFVAPAGALSALALMLALPWPTWRRLLIWFVIGMVVYFSYGVRRHSRLAQPTTRRGDSPRL